MPRQSSSLELLFDPYAYSYQSKGSQGGAQQDPFFRELPRVLI
jgi:hypothetical protein